MRLVRRIVSRQLRAEKAASVHSKAAYQADKADTACLDCLSIAIGAATSIVIVFYLFLFIHLSYWIFPSAGW